MIRRICDCAVLWSGLRAMWRGSARSRAGQAREQGRKDVVEGTGMVGGSVVLKEDQSENICRSSLSENRSLW